MKMPTTSMKEFFDERTKLHINRVRQNIETILTSFDIPGLVDRKKSHDLSKYGKIELIPYTFLTWYYKCKSENIDYEYPEGILKLVDSAIEHHYKANSHHCEYFQDITDMAIVDQSELVADLVSMSQERGGNPYTYFKSNIRDKYKFNDSQLRNFDKIFKLFDREY